MIQNFVNLDTLTEFTVLVILVGLITQISKVFFDLVFKKLFSIQKMPTEIVSFIISLILLLSASFARGDMSNKTLNEVFAIILVDIINSFIVALAANKGYERVTSDQSLITRIQFKK